MKDLACKCESPSDVFSCPLCVRVRRSLDGTHANSIIPIHTEQIHKDVVIILQFKEKPDKMGLGFT
jgi:hypothetical protein